MTAGNLKRGGHSSRSSWLVHFVLDINHNADPLSFGCGCVPVLDLKPALRRIPQLAQVDLRVSRKLVRGNARILGRLLDHARLDLVQLIENVIRLRFSGEKHSADIRFAAEASAGLIASTFVVRSSTD